MRLNVFPQLERSPKDKLDRSSILLDKINGCFAGICHLEIQRIGNPISSLTKQYFYLCQYLDPEMNFLDKSELR